MAGNVFPIIIDRSLSQKVKNFPDTIYNLNPNDYLTNLLNVLLGQAGTGQLTQAQTTATTNQDLPGIEFSDLDIIVGSILNTGRLSSEQYNSAYNPFIQQLPREIWDQINSADKEFRERLMLMLTAINSGATVLGITLLAESILKVKVRVIESWKAPYSGGAYYYPSIGESPKLASNVNYNTTYSSLFNTNSPSEFIIVPQGDNNFSQQTISDLMQLLELLKPINSIATFYDTNYSYRNIEYTSGNDYFELPLGYSPRATDLHSLVISDDLPDNTYIVDCVLGTGSTKSQIFVSTDFTASSTSESIISIDPRNVQISINTKQIVADSEWFEFDMLASTYQKPNTGISDLSQYPDRYWLNPTQPVTAPLFAHTFTMEEEINLNGLVSNILLVNYPSLDSLKSLSKSDGHVYAPHTFNVNSILNSANGRYYAKMQSDGNFVVYDRTPSPNKPYVVPSVNLNLGDIGPNVSKLQKWINQLDPPTPLINVNGNFDSYTKSAVEKYQYDKGLPVTGKVNSQTWGQILYDLNITSKFKDKALWSTKTNIANSHAILQSDGNFGVYSPNNTVQYNAGCQGLHVVMIMQDDGNLAIYQTTGAPDYSIYESPNVIWSSITGVQTSSTIGYSWPLQQNSPPPAQATSSTETTYGNWISIGLADSPDNYPQGKYQGDPNHYSKVTINFSGNTDTVLSELNNIQVDSTLGIPEATPIIPQQGSFTATNGMTHIFSYSGIENIDTNIFAVTGTPTGGTFDLEFYLNGSLTPEYIVTGIDYNATTLEISNAISSVITNGELNTNNLTFIVSGSILDGELAIEFSTAQTSGEQHTVNVDFISNLVDATVASSHNGYYYLVNTVFRGDLTDVMSINAPLIINGGYNWEWDSQSDYTAYMQKVVKKLNGELSTNKQNYRLPINSKQIQQVQVNVSKIMAPITSAVTSTIYGNQ